MLTPTRTVTREVIEAAELDARALELRKAGLTYERIADAIGVSSRGNAHRIVQRALQATIQEPADELRKMEGERLDALLRAMWPQAMQGNEKAVQTCLSILDRRAKLFNLDLGKARIELSGQDGGPIQTEQVFGSDPTELAAVVAILADAGVLPGITTIDVEPDDVVDAEMVPGLYPADPDT